MGGTGFAIINLVRDSFLEEIKLRALILARNISFSAEDFLIDEDDLPLTMLVRGALLHEGSVYSFILDIDGKAAASPAVLKPVESREDSFTIHFEQSLWQEKLAGAIVIPELKIDDNLYETKRMKVPEWVRGIYASDTLDSEGNYKIAVEPPWKEVYELAVPVVIKRETDEGGVIRKKLGEVHVGIDLTSLQIASRRIQMVVGGIAIVGIIIGIMGAFGLGALLIRPLKALVRGVSEIARGNFDFRIRKRTNDEIGDLTLAFNVMAKDLKDKVLIEDAFKRYVSHQVADEILEDPDGFAKSLKGEKRQITAFFADIRSFTTISEQLSPEEVVSFLNFYLTEMTTIIFNNEGTIDKFMGDCIMAIFGAPVIHGDDVYKAVKSGVEIQRKVEELNKQRIASGEQDIHVGIGINYGEAVVGNVGSTQRLEYTVIGDSVNTASRIQGLAQSGEVVVTDAVYREVKDLFEFHPMEPVKVKGKAKHLIVWKIKVPINTSETYPLRTRIDTDKPKPEQEGPKPFGFPPPQAE